MSTFLLSGHNTAHFGICYAKEVRTVVFDIGFGHVFWLFAVTAVVIGLGKLKKALRLLAEKLQNRENPDKFTKS